LMVDSITKYTSTNNTRKLWIERDSTTWKIYFWAKALCQGVITKGG
jgi:hypothetical protein